MPQLVGSTDAELLRASVQALTTRTGLPVAFGGFERADAVEVTAIAGTRTNALDGLVVHASRGLGGRALVEKRPRLALDYRTSRNITHDYDRAVLGEGISTLFAIPIIVSGRARGVLYCGSWDTTPLGDLAARTAFGIAADLGTELRIRDEVRRHLALLTPLEPTPLGVAAREELRESYAELRLIAAEVEDSTLRDRLRALEKRLAAMARGEEYDGAEENVRLSPREIDVLSCAGLGSTNAEIAATLSLKEGTVKSYMQSAMSKLDASTRHAAVVRARRIGVLP